MMIAPRYIVFDSAYSDQNWTPVPDFKSKLVDEKGQVFAANYDGCRYQIIEKQKREFSKWERFVRILLGIWVMANRALGIDDSSHHVKKLFTKDHENRYFGLLISRKENDSVSKLLLFSKAHPEQTWINVPKFEEYYDSVDQKGQTPVVNYLGPRYEFLVKQERIFSKWERLIRKLRGIWTIIRSFGGERFSQNVKDFFNKRHASRLLARKFVDPFAKESENIKIATESEILQNHWLTFDAQGFDGMAFGKKRWDEFLGDIGDEPPLPENIHEILKSPCPFWSGKRIEETHMLFLIPSTIDGKALSNLKTFREIVNAQTQKNGSKLSAYIFPQENFRDHQPSGQSYWVLMTKEAVNKKKLGFQRSWGDFLMKRKGYRIPV